MILNLLNKNLEFWPRIKGANLIPNVSSKGIKKWRRNSWGIKKSVSQNKKFHVVVFDFGIKNNILRNLYDLSLEITVVPFESSKQKITALKPDGIFLSNGPGDPAATGKYAIPIIKKLIEYKIPIFGICLGHQILSLALGAKTKKMSLGHRGANHPVKDFLTNKVEITSQNHGFEVDEKSIPKNVKVTHKSLFDGSIDGIRLKNKPVFSVQYHPESNPGPQDSVYLFQEFIHNIKRNAKKKRH